MRRRAFLLFGAGCAGLLLLFGLTLRHLSLVSLGLTANAETQAALRRTIEDQKTLVALDPARRQHYHRRFVETRTLLKRLEILAFSREHLERRFELVLLTIVAAMILTAAGGYQLDRRARKRRLLHLSNALTELSRGEGPVVVGDEGRDLIGQIARMIENTSAAVTRDRQRVQYLEHLSAWQEAARRHAHEMRTPLTAVQLELGRVMRGMAARLPEAAAELEAAETSIRGELEHLRTSIGRYVAFASIGAPRRTRYRVAEVIREFCETFAPNWPQLVFHFQDDGGAACADIDRGMIRQVLVNLCSNSALALAGRQGNVWFRLHGMPRLIVLDVVDDGPGVAAAVRRRLFEPYTTTRAIGEGMGLGLAISRKILLDHSGDLECIESARGAAFRLTLPRAGCPS